MDYKIKKLYEIAPMLSPSIYETIFYNQYQGRADKESLILDDEVFEKYYIDENIYRNFLFSNSSRLGKSLNYVGLNQMHNAIIKKIETKDGKLKIRLWDTGLESLTRTLIELKELKSININIESFYVNILFDNVYYCSNHYLDKDEILVPTNENIIESEYIQDQITYISKDEIEMVVSIGLKDEKDKEYNNKLRYFMLKCQNIIVEEEARDIWMKIFNESKYNSLYDYYINLRKSNKIILEKNICIGIIKKYEQFISDLDFF